MVIVSKKYLALDTLLYNSVHFIFILFMKYEYLFLNVQYFLFITELNLLIQFFFM